MSHADDVAARLRHELRTPINAILGYGQLLLEETDDATFGATERVELTQVVDAGRQLLRIVSDVLEPIGATMHGASGQLDQLREAMRLPLASALGHVQALVAGARDSAHADDLRRIQLALRRLDELVDPEEHITFTARGDAESGESTTIPGDDGAEAGTLAIDISSGTISGTILVIDDEEANRSLLERRLMRQGHRVLTAATGETGIAMAAAHPVDVILLDVMMPGIDGYEVLARLKQEPILREVPVLMITAVDGSASVTRCITLGADDYLAKPFDPVVLAARVSACVAKKHARDFELAYLRGVATVTEAAAAVESGRFVPSTLDAIAARTDALGQLARLFQRMAVEVAARERRLEAQVHQLTITIDEQKKAAQVQEITDSDYFRELKARAQHLSRRRAGRSQDQG
jgi:DNA-binding response OmpR family regulator